MWLVVVTLFCSFPQITQARVVRSQEDVERLEGYWSHQSESAQLERQRLEGLRAQVQEQKNFDKQREASLPYFLKEKTQEQKALSAVSQYYGEWLNNAWSRHQKQELAREAHIAEQRKQALRFQRRVTLSEEEELGLNIQRKRVPWEQRTFGPRSLSGSGSGGRPQPRSSEPLAPPPVTPPTDWSQAPESSDFPSPPPDYFESQGEVSLPEPFDPGIQEPFSEGFEEGTQELFPPPQF